MILNGKQNGVVEKYQSVEGIRNILVQKAWVETTQPAARSRTRQLHTIKRKWYLCKQLAETQFCPEDGHPDRIFLVFT